MQTCLSCKYNLPERAIYCPGCGNQVRCQQCRDILELNARACVTCGTHVCEAGIASATNNGTVHVHAVNTLNFKETSESRSLRASLTNTAVSSLGNALSVFIDNRVGVEGTPERRLSVQATSVTDQVELFPPAIISSPANQEYEMVAEAIISVDARLPTMVIG